MATGYRPRAVELRRSAALPGPPPQLSPTRPSAPQGSARAGATYLEWGGASHDRLAPTLCGSRHAAEHQAQWPRPKWTWCPGNNSWGRGPLQPIVRPALRPTTVPRHLPAYFFLEAGGQP